MSDSIKKYFETDRDYSDWMEQRWTKTTTLVKTDKVVQDVKDRITRSVVK